MQTSLARRQRHRRALQRQPRGRADRPSVGSSSSSSSSFSSPAVLAAGTGAVFAVRRLQLLRRGPARPGRSAQQHRLRAADDHLRPDRQGRARPVRRPASASSSPTTSCPARSSTRRPRSRTRTSGATRASTSRASSPPALDTSGPAARRLDDHPAARPRAAPAAEAFDGSDYERKVREIIQSIRLTQAFPGEEGKKTDHHRLPQPELLRQPELRREGRGQELLRQVARGPDPRPGRDPRRDPAVADEVRPDAQCRARSASSDRRRGRRSARNFKLVVPARVARSSSAATRCST